MRHNSRACSICSQLQKSDADASNSCRYRISRSLECLCTRCGHSVADWWDPSGTSDSLYTHRDFANESPVAESGSCQRFSRRKAIARSLGKTARGPQHLELHFLFAFSLRALTKLPLAIKPPHKRPSEGALHNLRRNGALSRVFQQAACRPLNSTSVILNEAGQLFLPLSLSRKGWPAQ